MLQQVDLFINIEILQREQQVVIAHLLNEVAPDAFRCLQQHFTALIVSDQPPERVARIVRQRFERIGKVRRRQVGNQHLHFRQIVGKRAVIVTFSEG